MEQCRRFIWVITKLFQELYPYNDIFFCDKKYTFCQFPSQNEKGRKHQCSKKGTTKPLTQI